jgi:putative zinc finger/helix-turn-helix YgiT family protein
MKPVDERVERRALEVQPLPECPDCGSTNTILRIEEQSFRYGRGSDAVELRCPVPLHTCNQCGCEWTGGDAEDARTVAICKYLRRLTPSEIRALRESCQLSQADFSGITGFGEASLSRWETGAQIQNASSDRLLRLIIADKKNLQRLQWIERSRGPSELPTFKAITPDRALLRRQAAFRLRRAG